MPKEKRQSPDDIINMFAARFGDSVEAYWFYDGDLCPCCLSRPIDEMMYDNKKALSVNAFMYRERGALIAYMLCGQCAPELMAESPKGPMSKHKGLESNLISAYLRYLNLLA